MARRIYKDYNGMSITHRKLKDVEAEIEILEEGLTRFRTAKSRNYETGIRDLQSQLEKARKR